MKVLRGFPRGRGWEVSYEGVEGVPTKNYMKPLNPFPFMKVCRGFPLWNPSTLSLLWKGWGVSLYENSILLHEVLHTFLFYKKVQWLHFMKYLTLFSIMEELQSGNVYLLRLWKVRVVQLYETLEPFPFYERVEGFPFMRTLNPFPFMKVLRGFPLWNPSTPSCEK